nr:CHASE domain-containing protein [uncultured Roseococcus sp.]
MTPKELLAPPSRRMLAIAAAVLLGGLALSAGARTLAVQLIHDQTERKFASDMGEVTAAVGDRLRAHAEVLVSMQGLFASVGRVNRSQFRRYVEVLELGHRHPGFQALQALRRVEPGHLDAFLAEVRSDMSVDPRGLPQFAVTPPGPRLSYSVVEFVEPLRGNENSLGFDAGANPLQLDSLRRATETGRMVATPPVRLVQDNSGGLGFILRAPIYRVSEPVQTIAQRRAALHGFVAAVYRLNDLMRGVLGTHIPQQAHIRILDRGYGRTTLEGLPTHEPEDPSVAASLMYDSLEPNLRLVTPVASSPLGISAERSLVVGDRVWLLQFAAREGSIYERDSVVPNLVLASGAAISLLAAFLVLILMRSRRLSGSLTALGAEQRALVENPLAGILFTTGRRVERGNHRLAALCGLSLEELPGLDIARLLARPEDSEAFDAALARIREGLPDAVQLHLRGSQEEPITVDAFGQRLAGGRDANGQILWVIQDKTDALKVEEERRDHARELQSANARLTELLHSAEARTQEIALLTELSGILQSCIKPEEVFAAVRGYAARLLPDEAGALYLLSPARDHVTLGTSWGDLKAGASSFAPDSCWALRRGQPFPLSDASRGLVCEHVAPHSAELPDGSVCLPLIAQNNLLGLLYREPGVAGPEGAGARLASTQLATMLAEQVSLSIANIELREQLRGQALRDPLTGLHNRRFLHEALARETARVVRNGSTLALAILDLDHFKSINDSYSHETGDAVLRGLGDILRQVAGPNDVVGRLGGEEFLILMPGAELAAARARMETLLDAIRALRVPWPGGVLDGITASIGLALFPLNVERGEGLTEAADAALYRAKAEGRDRVVVSDGV